MDYDADGVDDVIAGSIYEDIYLFRGLGKGKFAKADAKKFAGGDDKGWFTGGWAGGEIALKNGEQVSEQLCVFF